MIKKEESQEPAHRSVFRKKKHKFGTFIKGRKLGVIHLASQQEYFYRKFYKTNNAYTQNRIFRSEVNTGEKKPLAFVHRNHLYSTYSRRPHPPLDPTQLVPLYPRQKSYIFPVPTPPPSKNQPERQLSYLINPSFLIPPDPLPTYILPTSLS